MAVVGGRLQQQLIVGLAILAAGTVLFSVLENMSTIDAFYASGTMLATIGYGDKAPKTQVGRLATVMFGFLAIGLYGSVIESVGTYLRKLTENNAKGRSPLLLGILWVVQSLGAGTLLFVMLEGWSFVDSLYFCFVTLTSIGFGDVIPVTPLGKICVVFYSLYGSAVLMFVTVAAGRWLNRNVFQEDEGPLLDRPSLASERL